MGNEVVDLRTALLQQLSDESFRRHFAQTPGKMVSCRRGRGLLPWKRLRRGVARCNPLFGTLARTETLHMSLWERDWQVKSTVDDEEHQKFDLEEGHRLFAMSRKNCFYNA